MYNYTMALKETETQYKESWRDEYLKWIAGFANVDGGVLSNTAFEISRKNALKSERMSEADAGKLGVWGRCLGLDFLKAQKSDIKTNCMVERQVL